MNTRFRNTDVHDAYAAARCSVRPIPPTTTTATSLNVSLKPGGLFNGEALPAPFALWAGLPIMAVGFATSVGIGVCTCGGVGSCAFPRDDAASNGAAPAVLSGSRCWRVLGDDAACTRKKAHTSKASVARNVSPAPAPPLAPAPPPTPGFFFNTPELPTCFFSACVETCAGTGRLQFRASRSWCIRVRSSELLF